MARIRTIKPSFFRHEALFDGEQETGLPLRIAYAGLWTAADREGRFEWRPRSLKLDCLPHDPVDFSRVLDALATRGFIIRYVIGGVAFGCIPTWHEHQVVNNRETASEIPPCPQDILDKWELTRGARVDDASGTRHDLAQGEQEGEGKGTDLETASAVSSPSDPVVVAFAKFNDTAGEVGLPVAQVLTQERRTKLKARLAECDGLPGWDAAMARIRGSPFLRGENDRGWKADLDFVLQKKSFTRLMEGAYERTAGKPQFDNGFAELLASGEFGGTGRN